MHSNQRNVLFCILKIVTTKGFCFENKMVKIDENKIDMMKTVVYMGLQIVLDS